MSIYDPTDPTGKMFFNILATFAECEADFIRLRTKEGMAIARAKGKQPYSLINNKKNSHACMPPMTDSISDLAEVFAVSRPTIYRTLHRTGAKISP